MATPKQAAVDMANALKDVFKKHTLSSRERAWNTLMSKDGHKAMETLLLHPTKPTNIISKLNFKEWVLIECVESIAKKSKVDIKGIDLKQLEMGFKVEKEHNGKRGKDTKVTDNDSDTLKIAVAHLRELPDYYTRLKKVESGL